MRNGFRGLRSLGGDRSSRSSIHAIEVQEFIRFASLVDSEVKPLAILGVQEGVFQWHCTHRLNLAKLPEHFGMLLRRFRHEFGCGFPILEN